MSWLVIQALWFGLAASIILVDGQLMRQRLAVAPAGPDPETYDLKDRSVGSFVLAMVLLGGFVIPFYLWYSRRSSRAVVVGIGLMVGCAALIALLSAALVPR
ncbi:MAG TPA: hypothetical protein VFG86_23020 [Chloroflexota bacterium]|jgi:hypothetical protein|nr:hypothetical protein [Chloroflexota bacterium]